jgi:hypothetical protein
MANLKSKLEAPRAFGDPVEHEQLSRDLSSIYEVIRRQGWIQGMLGRPGGPRCLGGAIYEIIDGSTVGAEARARTERVIAALGFVSAGALVAFNDATGRTREQVLERVSNAMALNHR